MITATFPAIVLKTGNRKAAVPVEVTLAYDPDYDPLAVQAIISAEGEPDIVWYFGRDLLLRGVNNFTPVGSGDVKFRFDGANQVLMCLRNPVGHADIGLPHPRVVAFLNETTRELPASGEECPVEMIDELIEEILNG